MDAKKMGGYSATLFLLLAAGITSSGGAQEVKPTGFYPYISVAGQTEVVFNYNTQRCEDLDIPDSPLRAYRTAGGEIMAFSSHYLNRRLIGTDLGNLHHDCRVVYQGAHDPDPADFNDRTWLASTWTEDGKAITALGHNEYQADKFAGKCIFNSYGQCCYTSIVLLQSRDGGYSFIRSDLGRPRPVAASPFKSEVAQGHSRGYYDPSNIVFANGYYYVLIAQRGIEDTHHLGRCVFRSKDPSRLDAWTLFDGFSYVPSAGSAYEQGRQHPLCEPVKGMTGTLGSIAKVRGSNLFAAFSIDADFSPEGGELSVSYSDDLIHWAGKQTIMKLSAFWSKSCSKGSRFNYASVLDNSDKGRNFDTIGEDPWLFMVRAGCNITMDRDLVRIPLRITKPTSPNGTAD